MCKCGSVEVAYVFSAMKIKRYKMVCADCGRYIQWVSNTDWEELKNIVIPISQKLHDQIINDYCIKEYGE